MKTTININGLDVEFSDQKPTRPGAYWWRYDKNSGSSVVEVRDEGAFLWVTMAGESGGASIEDWVGLWSTSPLVPAVEVEVGAHELWCDAAHGTCGSPQEWRRDWLRSRARRVVEGLQ